jgi:hypothetical protein
MWQRYSPFARMSASVGLEHFQINDALNAWYIDPRVICGNVSGPLAPGCTQSASSSDTFEAPANENKALLLDRLRTMLWRIANNEVTEEARATLRGSTLIALAKPKKNPNVTPQAVTPQAVTPKQSPQSSHPPSSHPHTEKFSPSFG